MISYLFAAIIAAQTTVLLLAGRRHTRLARHLAAETWRADHDQLTRLPNRHVLHRVIGEWLQQRRPIAVLMVDLDHLHDMNRIYGHAAGDTLIVHAAARLCAAVAGTGGVAVRLGGDEFVVAWPDLTHADADAHAAQVHARLTGTPVEVSRRTLPLQASGGLTIANGPEHSSLGQLLARADEARAHAKNHRRNTVVTWQHTLPTVRDTHTGRPRARLRDYPRGGRR
ncbi:MAG: GGDEF domain-containing protein [Hamadaea sp.]|nr:GGDEF domain-containing protein [Hamadaea sp.]